MKKYQSILVAIDVFDTSQPVIAEAQNWAKRFNTKLQIAYVLPNLIANLPYAYDFQSQVEQDAQKSLEQIQQDNNLNPKNVHFLHGNPKDQIPELAKEQGCDLIMVGSHGKHGLELMLGSTANGILHMAECDVLTVRLDRDNKRVISGDYHNILLATDLEEDSQLVVKRAKAIADSYKSNLHAINVVPNTTATAIAYYPNIEVELRKVAEQQLQKLAQENGIAKENAHALIGLPRAMITDTAVETKSDLIVIGSRTRTGLASVLIGSTANAVLHHANQDVLVVRI